MDSVEIFIILSIVLTEICAILAVLIFAYDCIVAFSKVLAGGGGGHKWSRAPLLLGAGAILFAILSIVGVIAG